MVERFTFDVDDGYVLATDYDALAARLAESERLLLAADHDPYNEHIRDGDEWLTRWHAFFGTRITDSAEGGPK